MNGDGKRELQEALRMMEDTSKDILEALRTPEGPACSVLLKRAYTQLAHSAQNVSRANACIQLPPELQPYTLPRRRRYALGEPERYEKTL